MPATFYGVFTASLDQEQMTVAHALLLVLFY